MTESPGVTGEPGVVVAPGLPGVVGGTESRVPGTGSRYRVPVIKPESGPGVTGTCSEYTGRLTDDCRTDPFLANRAL